jgi:hypothetical protein
MQLFNTRYIKPLSTVLPTHVHEVIFYGVENIINVAGMYICSQINI